MRKIAPQSFRFRSRHRSVAKAARRSRGVVLVEMAVCLPLMILVVFGCIEVSSGIFRTQVLVSAAHEAAVVGMNPNSTEEQVRDRLNVILQARGVDQFEMSIETRGVGFENLQTGDPFTIFVSSELQNIHFTARGVSASATALRP